MYTELHTPHDHIEDETAAQLRESAYRRVFQQGLQHTIEIIANGVSLADLHEYMEQVATWRDRRGKYKAKRERLHQPPVSKRVKI